MHSLNYYTYFWIAEEPLFCSWDPSVFQCTEAAQTSHRHSPRPHGHSHLPHQQHEAPSSHPVTATPVTSSPNAKLDSQRAFQEIRLIFFLPQTLSVLLSQGHSEILAEVIEMKFPLLLGVSVGGHLIHWAKYKLDLNIIKSITFPGLSHPSQHKGNVSYFTHLSKEICGVTAVTLQLIIAQTHIFKLSFMLPQKSKYPASVKLIVFLQSDNVYTEEVASL